MLHLLDTSHTMILERLSPCLLRCDETFLCQKASGLRPQKLSSLSVRDKLKLEWNSGRDGDRITTRIWGPDIQQGSESRFQSVRRGQARSKAPDGQNRSRLSPKKRGTVANTQHGATCNPAVAESVGSGCGGWSWTRACRCPCCSAPSPRRRSPWMEWKWTTQHGRRGKGGSPGWLNWLVVFFSSSAHYQSNPRKRSPPKTSEPS